METPTHLFFPSNSVGLVRFIPKSNLEKCQRQKWVFDRWGEYRRNDLEVKFTEARGVIQVPNGYVAQLHLGHLDDLTFVSDLKQNSLFGLELIGFPAGLESKQFKPFEKLRDLKNLTAIQSLPDKLLSRISCFQEIEELLLLDSFEDETLSVLKALPKLKHLVLWQIGTEAFTHIRKISNLSVLVIPHSTVSPEGLSSLAFTKSLSALNLASTTITAPCLESLTELRSLTRLGLSATNLEDANLITLAKFKQLKFINLTNNNLTKAGLLSLHSALPECIVRHDHENDCLYCNSLSAFDK